ncbi:hypothetical protein T439DRAFT_360490 [Meredithblackwellia eburnea MCA 4105]
MVTDIERMQHWRKKLDNAKQNSDKYFSESTSFNNHATIDPEARRLDAFNGSRSGYLKGHQDAVIAEAQLQAITQLAEAGFQHSKPVSRPEVASFRSLPAFSGRHDSSKPKNNERKSGQDLALAPNHDIQGYQRMRRAAGTAALLARLRGGSSGEKW